MQTRINQDETTVLLNVHTLFGEEIRIGYSLADTGCSLVPIVIKLTELA